MYYNVLFKINSSIYLIWEYAMQCSSRVQNTVKYVAMGHYMHNKCMSTNAISLTNYMETVTNVLKAA